MDRVLCRALPPRGRCALPRPALAGAGSPGGECACLAQVISNGMLQRGEELFPELLEVLKDD